MKFLFLVVLMAFGCCLLNFAATGSPTGTLVREGARLQMRKRALPRRLEDNQVVNTETRREELVEQHFRNKRGDCCVACYSWCRCCYAK